MDNKLCLHPVGAVAKCFRHKSCEISFAPNIFYIFQIVRKLHCHGVCTISKRLDNWNGCYRQTRFREIWFYDDLAKKYQSCGSESLKNAYSTRFFFKYSSLVLTGGWSLVSHLRINYVTVITMLYAGFFVIWILLYYIKYSFWNVRTYLMHT